MNMKLEKTDILPNNKNNDKVLIVDDELPVVLGIKRALRGGRDIDVAVGASQALQYIHRHGPYAVIVSDLRMPGIDGIGFLSEVKRCWPDTVRILLTGDATSQSTIEAINKAGVFRFLQKPFKIDKLRDVITQAIDEYECRIKPKKFDKDIWTHFNNDMKDPLRCLMEFADFVKQEATAPVELHAYADYVSKSGGEFVAMSEAAATLSAIETGERRLRRKKISLKSMLRNTIKTLEEGYEKATFIVDYDGEIPDLRIDPHLCDVAVRALVEDAMQFNEDATTITLRASFEEDDDESLVLELDDKGPQFDVEQSTYFTTNDVLLRTPFYRNRGVGLRLSLARNIAELHGGTLELFNREEKNYTTILKLPNSAW
ncbi:MAG: hybrid sensor histidine kinase/response regulator [Hyphomicrobiales bacterium]